MATTTPVQQQEVVRLLYSPWKPWIDEPHKQHSALTPGRLEGMRALESTLLCDKDFRAHCTKPTSPDDDGAPCSPLSSLVPVFFEQGYGAFGETSSGGGGTCPAPAAAAAVSGGDGDGGGGNTMVRADWQETLAVVARQGLGDGYLAAAFTAENLVELRES